MSPIARRGLCLVRRRAVRRGQDLARPARSLEAEPELALSVSVTTRAAARRRSGRACTTISAAPARSRRWRPRGELLEWAHCVRPLLRHAARAGGGGAGGRPRHGVRHRLAGLPAGPRRGCRPTWSACSCCRRRWPPWRRRLVGRGADGAAEIARRMQAARAEMAHAPEFDHVVVNLDFAAALAECRAVLRAARLATPRLAGLAGFLAGMDG